MASIRSGELTQILAEKPNNVGEIFANSVKSSVYYTEKDSMVSLAEETISVGKKTYTLSTQIGGTDEVRLTNDKMISYVVLELQLPQGSGGASKKGIGLGWAYAFIDYIEVLVGGSNYRIRMTGHDIIHMVLAQQETSEKMTDIIRFAGQDDINVVVSDYGSKRINNAYANDTIYGFALLPLPWSNLATSLDIGKPLPTDVLSGPVLLTIKTREAGEVMTALGVETVPSNFTKARVIVRESQFTDLGFSLRNPLITNPSVSYDMPFYAGRSGAQRRLITSTLANHISDTFVEITLEGLENADLVAILFSINRQSDLSNNKEVAHNYFDFLEVQDIELTFNGEVIMHFEDKSEKLFNLIQSNKSGCLGLDYSGIKVNLTPDVLPQDVASYEGSGKRYINELILSRLSPMLKNHTFQNVRRYTNGALNLKFKILDRAKASGATNYYFNSTYIYPAQISLHSGVSDISLK